MKRSQSAVPYRRSKSRVNVDKVLQSAKNSGECKVPENSVTINSSGTDSNVQQASQCKQTDDGQDISRDSQCPAWVPFYYRTRGLRTNLKLEYNVKSLNYIQREV